MSGIKSPLVSIVTATFNSKDFIELTYESILNQTHKNWEWIITDDCSTDETIYILNRISAEDSRVKVFRNKINSGAAVSRNKCLVEAKGDFIAFIDSDDLWLKDKLQKQIQFMGRKINFSFTSYEIINDSGESLNKFVDYNENDINVKSFGYTDMLKKNATLGCSTVMLRRSIFNDIKMPLLRTGQDYATWLMLLQGGHRAFLLSEPLGKYRIVAGSISRNKFKKAIRQWEIYRKIRGINYFMSMYYFAHYAIKAVVR